MRSVRSFGLFFFFIRMFRLMCCCCCCNQYASLALSFAQRRTVGSFSIWFQCFVCVHTAWHTFIYARNLIAVEPNTKSKFTLTRFNFPCCFCLFYFVINNATAAIARFVFVCAWKRERKREHSSHQIRFIHTFPAFVWRSYVCVCVNRRLVFQNILYKKN